jgi:glutathione peroxidase
MSNFYDFELKDCKGELVIPNKNKKHIVINVASECGYTKENYQDLVSMLETVDVDKVDIYLYPCNDFGGQEPGTMEEIKTFCDTYGVMDYPNVHLMEKVVLKDSQLWHWLEYTNEGSTVYGHDFEAKWNFYKYFIDPDGSMWGLSYSHESLLDEDVLDWINSPWVSKEERESILTDMVVQDQEMGLYDDVTPIEIEGEIIGEVENSIHNPELYDKINQDKIEYTSKLKDFNLSGSTEE